MLRVARELERDLDEHQPDHDRGELVPGGRAGQLVQSNAGGSDRDARERGAVLEQDHLHARIATRANVVAHRRARLLRLAARLLDRPYPRDALGDAADDEDDPGDAEPAGLRRAGEQLVGAIPDGEDGAREEHPNRGDKRPEEALASVAEWLPGIG